MIPSTTPRARAREMTEWFPADVKPVRPGVYEIFDGQLRSTWYCYFDMRFWFYGAKKPEWANDYAVFHRGPTRWRGLKEPK